MSPPFKSILAEWIEKGVIALWVVSKRYIIKTQGCMNVVVTITRIWRVTILHGLEQLLCRSILFERLRVRTPQFVANRQQTYVYRPPNYTLLYPKEGYVKYCLLGLSWPGVSFWGVKRSGVTWLRGVLRGGSCWLYTRRTKRLNTATDRVNVLLVSTGYKALNTERQEMMVDLMQSHRQPHYYHQ